jgi:hypothetical protein
VPAGQYIQFDDPAIPPVALFNIYVPGEQMNDDGRDEPMRVTEAEAEAEANVVGALLGRGLDSTVVVL